MLSIVVPVFNEEQSLAALHQELDEVAAAENYDLEVIFVDDGSTDGSWVAIERLAEQDPRVRGVRFRRNFGKTAALDAGFSCVRGETIMTLDADLQDDPHEIPRFLREIGNGLDLVSGWKRTRHDPWHKVLASRVFNWMIATITGVKLHDHNCGIKCYRREVLDEVRLYGELHRFVPVLAAARGFRVGELVIHHRPRQFGRSKYGFTRFMKGFLDLLSVKFTTTYAMRPQHFLGTVGLLSLGFGVVWLLCLAACGIAAWATRSESLPGSGGYAALVGSVGFVLLGGQLLSIGLLAELLLAQRGPDAKPYSIAERTRQAASVSPSPTFSSDSADS